MTTTATVAPDARLARIEAAKAAGMNDYDAAGIAEGFVDNDDPERARMAWQYLHDTGLGYRLQGWFGRSLASLIDAGEVLA